MLSIRSFVATTPATDVTGAPAWAERLLTGPPATMLAVIAVAWFGLMMLSGRLAVRKGALVVAGCFVLFGAPTMAKALLVYAQQTNHGSPIAVVAAPAPDAPPTPPSPPAYDPYAGASLPGR